MAKKEKQTETQCTSFPCVVQASSRKELQNKIENIRQELPEGMTLTTGAVGQSKDKTTYSIYADVVKP